MCGAELDFWDLQAEFNINNERIPYGSVHDGEAIHMHFCCECFDKLVDSCAVSPIVE